MGRRPLLKPRLREFSHSFDPVTTYGISGPFEPLSPVSGQVAYVLRTHSPLPPGASSRFSFDLHVLSTPPAFILSQDQTLRKYPLPQACACGQAHSSTWTLLLARVSHHSSVVKVPSALALRPLRASGAIILHRPTDCQGPRENLSKSLPTCPARGRLIIPLHLSLVKGSTDKNTGVHTAPPASPPSSPLLSDLPCVTVRSPTAVLIIARLAILSRVSGKCFWIQQRTPGRGRGFWWSVEVDAS